MDDKDTVRRSRSSARSRSVAPDQEQREPGRIPQISLPKGGGALRSIDEKFSVNASNGTCEITIPLPFAKTRSGLDGSVSLHYSSGSGNGAFGLGWSLTLSSIQRRTDKQLPRYQDDVEGDVFLFSGAEDLVPSYSKDTNGSWVRDVASNGATTAARYRPRIEGLFARIEKISVPGESGFYWKVTTRENVVTILGRSANARIADPKAPARIFRWLPQWTYDDKGNCAEYVYKDEDVANVQGTVEEKNRLSGVAPFSNKYLKRIRYGNQNPYYPDSSKAFDPPPPQNPGYLFETVLDYGEHDDAAPAPSEVRTWPSRLDPFSEYRAGFEIRTYRLCRRILFFHSLAELDYYPAPYLVRSVDLDYANFHFDNAPYKSQEADFIVAVRPVHYKKTAANVYQSGSWPALELAYQPLNWNKTVEAVSPEDVVGAPGGVGEGYQWLDLYGEGVSGILTEQAATWYFKSNLGDGHFSGVAEVVPKPSFGGVTAGAAQFGDLDANGSKQLIAMAAEPRGYFELDDNNEWLPFRPFEQLANIDFSDPNTRFLDLNGDGAPDLVVSEEQVFRWYRSLGTRGHDLPEFAPKPFDEEQGPSVLFGDGTQTVFIADMTGDGLSDIVRIRNGEVCYWPNLGYGQFGPKVTMRNAPVLDVPEQFDPTMIQLADVSGTGAADLIYLGRDGFAAWINLAGNAWSDAQRIDPFPGTEVPNRVSVLDLLGNGTASIVWSSELPASGFAPLRYVDLMGGKKPYIISGYRNNLGKHVKMEYKSSCHFSLLDKKEGRPWATKLPFPTMCVSRVETSDSVSGSLFVQEYRYRHGYYDHAEREFRGFGMVEQTDAEAFDKFEKSGAGNVVDVALQQAPVRTRTWFHTGAYVNGARILGQFARDYYPGAATPEHPLQDAVIEADTLTPDELRQAARACKGTTLRQEVYADDGSTLAAIPYSTAEHNCQIRMIQPTLGNRYAVFLPSESESIHYRYERDAADPRIAHDLNTVIDEFGNVVESASVVYGRVAADPAVPSEVQAEQGRIRTSYTLHAYTNDVATNSALRLRKLCETQVFELTGIVPAAAYFTPAEIRTAFLGAAPIGYEQQPQTGFLEKRQIRMERSLFASNANANVVLPLGSLESLGLSYEDYRLAFTQPLLTALYGARVTDLMLGQGKYLKGDDYRASGLFPNSDPAGYWWTRTGTAQYPANPDQHFYLPNQYTDPFGNPTLVRYYGNYHLLVDRIQDALGNQTTVLGFDFRFLQPQAVKDINDNLTEVSLDILGLVVGTAIRGKGNEADDLTAFQPDITQAQIDAFLSDPVTQGPALLQNATSRFVYSFQTLPSVAASIRRETHAQTALATGTPSRLQYAFAYSGGLGQVAMNKVQAEPGKAKSVDVNPDATYTVTEVDTTPNLRWVGNGRTVVNNKGNKVLEYEPYFSVTPAYENADELVETGVTAVFHYDPVDRLVRTDYPDGSFATVEFNAWMQKTFDRNDNVLASNWYALRTGGGMGLAEQSAAQKTKIHDSTPAVTYLDSLGRAIYVVQDNKFVDRSTNTVREEFYATFLVLDISGNCLAARDARGNFVMRSGYDMLGHPDAAASMDGGPRWTLSETTGKAFYSWDARGNQFHTVYDALLRPVQHEVLTAANTTVVYEKSVYGTDKTRNLNGKLATQYDESGLITHDAYDFKGNLLSATRQFTQDYVNDHDWSNPAAVALQIQTYTSQSAYDALSRVLTSTSPDGSVTTATYSEAGLLTGISASIRGGASQPFIAHITHDSKSQRQRIDYANGAVTSLDYDAQTFRVRRIQTTRASDHVVLQDLAYTYDPVGNVTEIGDSAQQQVFFNNLLVLPQNDYLYDAVYRLLAAKGREHIGQNAPVNEFDEFRTNLPHPADGTAMRNYLQQYDYDFAGNLSKMVHSSGSGPFTNQWTRQFTPATTNNRLVSSQVGATIENYSYDLHGNAVSIPGMPTLNWDFEDRLRSVDLGGGGIAHYTYDASGSRVRKVIERQGGIVEGRLYLGAVEIFTKTAGGATQLQRETLHLMDGSERLALVDTRTAGNDGTPAQLIRYQFSNHLGSALLELDDAAQIITYEEYYPYGSTSFQSVDASRTVPAKRYRYTGKERDEETGLYYQGLRFLAPWIARWISCDPAGISDGLNLYAYGHDAPTRLIDPSGTQTVDPQNTQLTPLTFLDTRSSEERMAARHAGALGDFHLRLGDPVSPYDLAPHMQFDPTQPWLPSKPAGPGDPTSGGAKPAASSSGKSTQLSSGKNPKVTFDLIPPKLQVEYLHRDLRYRLTVDTSSVEAGIFGQTPTFQGKLALQYKYGKDLSILASGATGGGSVGVNPQTGVWTFGLQQKPLPSILVSEAITTRGAFTLSIAGRIGPSTGKPLPVGETPPTSAGSFVTPERFRPGAPGIEFQDVGDPFRAAESAGVRMLREAPQVLGDPRQVPGFVSRHSSVQPGQKESDFASIGRAADAGAAIHDIPRALPKPDLRWRIDLSVDPQTKFRAMANLQLVF
jgi:RHS repeat-associated protein